MTRQTAEDIAAVQRGTTLSNALVSSVLSQIRSAEEYLITPSPGVKADFLASGDSAYAYQSRLRQLPHLEPGDRHLINLVAARQAELEVAFATAHALADIGRGDEARFMAAQAGGASDSLVSLVRGLSEEQGQHVLDRARALQDRAAFYQTVLIACALLALAVGIGAGVVLVRVVDQHLNRLIASADRFGDGDLRPARQHAMPAELARLARALNDMAARLREVVEAVVREAQQLAASQPAHRLRRPLRRRRSPPRPAARHAGRAGPAGPGPQRHGGPAA